MGILQSFAFSNAQNLCGSDVNPFIGELASNGVKLYPKPIFTKAACAVEWQYHGSCCDANSLVKYATKEIEDLKKANQFFHKEVESLMKYIQWKHISKAFSTIVSQFKNATSESHATIKAALDNAKKISDLLAKVTPQLEILGLKDDTCIDKLIRIMTSSFCNTCSARSKIFFKESKAIMKQTDCNKVIDKCYAYWKSLIFVLDEMGTVSNLISEMKKLEKIEGSVEQTNTTSIDFLSSWVRHHSLRQRFESCTSPRNCSSSTAAAICSSLISIKKRFPIF